MHLRVPSVLAVTAAGGRPPAGYSNARRELQGILRELAAPFRSEVGHWMQPRHRVDGQLRARAAEYEAVRTSLWIKFRLGHSFESSASACARHAAFVIRSADTWHVA